MAVVTPDRLTQSIRARKLPVREIDAIGAVIRHQQPACQPALEVVASVGERCGLHVDEVSVLQKPQSQRRTVLHFRAQDTPGHALLPPCRAHYQKVRERQSMSVISG